MTYTGTLRPKGVPGGTPYKDLYREAPPERGPGGTLYNDLYREAPPERGPGGYSL